MFCALLREYFHILMWLSLYKMDLESRIDHIRLEQKILNILKQILVVKMIERQAWENFERRIKKLDDLGKYSSQNLLKKTVFNNKK